MGENNIESLLKLKRNIFLIYSLGCGVWFIVWYFLDGYGLMSNTFLLWFPFIACLIILIANMLLWKSIERNEDCENYDKELQKIQYVERNAAHMVTAITGVLIIAAAISAMKGNTPIPKDVIMFESTAFICSVVGVLPKYWIPSKKSHWMVVLRHLKTVPFTYAISLFLSGLLTLLYWL